MIVERFNHIILKEGSTRPIALFRIGIVLIAWSRLSRDLVLVADKPFFAKMIGLCFLISSLFLFLGAYTRVASFLTGGFALMIYYYLGSYLGFKNLVSHHVYTLCFLIFLLSLTPCGRSFSVDRWREMQRAIAQQRVPSEERGPLWGTFLMGLQISVIYFYAALDKTSASFLNGSQLEGTFLFHLLGSNYPSWSGFTEIAIFLSAATVLLEYGLVFLLWTKRFRVSAIVLGIIFHLLMFYSVPLRTFSITMCLSYLLFLNPDTVSKVLDRLLGKKTFPHTHLFKFPTSQFIKLSISLLLISFLWIPLSKKVFPSDPFPETAMETYLVPTQKEEVYLYLKQRIQKREGIRRANVELDELMSSAGFPKKYYGVRLSVYLPGNESESITQRGFEATENLRRALNLMIEKYASNWSIEDMDQVSFRLDFMIDRMIPLVGANFNNFEEFELNRDGLRLSHQDHIRYIIPGDDNYKLIKTKTDLVEKIQNMFPHTHMSEIEINRFRAVSYQSHNENLSQG